MGKSTIESRTLQKAAEILGGRLKLAKRLQVPIMALDKWLAGEEIPPHTYFLQAVDVVLYQEAVGPSAPCDETTLPRESDRKTGDPFP